MNLNIKAKKEHTYDAIVVGTGISGGWAAKELCGRGLKTLVLERGRNVEHVVDYPTMHMNPWEAPYGNKVPDEELKQYPIQKLGGYMRQDTKHWWVNDLENPYEQVKSFSWIRGYHVGGRSLLWSRQCYRLSDMDFSANAKDGHGADWPIRYADIAPWYDKVESFIGVSGQKEGLPQLPDGNFLPPMEMSCVEEHVRKRIAAKFDNRLMTIGRTANLTQNHNGRVKCQNRNRCVRGCPYGGYFSSNSSTLPAATATGNMTLRPHSIVNEIIYDDATQKATGVRIIDAETKEVIEYYAKIIFLNASTLGSVFVLLNSTSDRFPNGLGNDSGELGHNLMDHHHQVGARAVTDDFSDRYHSGRRPNGVYIPRFRNITIQRKDYVRGFGYQGRSLRSSWTRGKGLPLIGSDLKNAVQQPGPWSMYLGGFGECLPYHENKVTLNHTLRDKWGQPTLSIDCEFKGNEKAMRLDMAESAAEMLEASGMKNVSSFNNEPTPGMGIHEMGTARMGRDPKTSVLNEYNQVHAVKNLFVTDGSCMASSGCQNPSLTYMALTARAANFAADELSKGNL